MSDFGLAKVTEGSQNTISHSGAGTLAWMAPGFCFNNIKTKLQRIGKRRAIYKVCRYLQFCCYCLGNVDWRTSLERYSLR